MKVSITSCVRWALSGAAVCLLLAIGCAKPSMPDLSSDSTPSHSSLTIWHDSFDVAREQSLATGKPILADFTGSDWCGWCIKLREDVFETAEFEAWARDNVVLLELDYPKRSSQDPAIKAQNEKLASLYGIDSFPTVLLLDAQGNKLARMGYQKSPGGWISKLESQMQ